MAAHRFWRFHGVNNNDGYLSISEIRFTLADGTWPAGGVAVCNPNPYSSPDLAYDNNTNTFWANFQPNGITWLGYDFGAGNEQDIYHVAITSRGDGYDVQSPSGGSVEYSDDGNTWSLLANIPNQPNNWGSAETRTFTVNGPPQPAQINGEALVTVFTNTPEPADINQMAIITVADYIPSDGGELSTLAMIVVAGEIPPHTYADVSGFALVVAAYIAPYIPPPKVINLPCLSWCLPLYYVQEQKYV